MPQALRHARRWFFAPLCATMVGASTGCNSQPVGSGEVPITSLPRTLTSGEQYLISANNQFAFSLFRAIANSAGPDSNVFVSPLSAAMALGMAYDGAAGATQTQMQQVLGFAGMTVDQVDHSYQSLITLLERLDPEVQVVLGNSLWYDQGLTPLATFLNASRSYFGATVQSLDFSSPGAATTINNWVSNETHGRIPTIVSGAIPPGTVMYLLNAIYFNGAWTSQFDKSHTRPAPFRLRTGDTTSVLMMSHGAPPLRVAYADTVTFPQLASDGVAAIVDLPYGGQAFSMTVVLPRTPAGADSIASGLTADKWTSWIARLYYPGAVEDVDLPKFTFSYGRKLNDVLSALGMPSAFCSSGQADFAGISDAPLCVSEVRHRAFVSVDEAGTEAAAATSVALFEDYANDVGPVVVDRPFLFVIRERLSGTIMFIGRVMNPTATAM